MSSPPPENPDSYRIAIAASFTAAPIESAIAFWARELPLPLDVSFAPYDQIFQQLLDSGSVLAGNRRGLNVIMLRLEDLDRSWRTANGEHVTSPAGLRAAMTELAGRVREVAARWPVPVLVVSCPSSPAFRAAVGDELIAAIEHSLVDELRGSAAQVLGAADLESWYPGAGTQDPYADRLGHVPYTSAAFAAIGTAIVRRLHRILVPAPKVVVVDADNTLWDGVAGEGTLSDIDIGPARQSIQDMVLAQRDAGRLICLCSRNTEADTLAVLDRHPMMRLRTEDFTGVRVNWRSKSDNLRDLAAQLGLGLDSFVFVDDSPLECAEVRERCPEVAVLELPADAIEAERFLRHCWVLDIGRTTDDDAARATYYRAEVERTVAREASPGLADFLDSLMLRVDITRPAEADIPRFAQLAQRTNQFTLTTTRHTETDVHELLAAHRCLLVTAQDRFGSYGTVGAIAFEATGTTLRVDTFLVSCRALGRGIEHRMLAHLGRLAVERGLETVTLAYRRTGRNQPAADFVRWLRAAGPDEHLDDGDHSVPAATAAEATYRPSGDVRGVRAPAAPPEPPSRESVGAALWSMADRLSPSLTTAEQIEARIRSAHTPGDSVESTVNALMADVLGLRAVDPDDNFFELGGTSVLLVQLMSRVRDGLGVELPMDTLYNSELTARNVGLSVRLRAMGEAGDVEAMLELVNSMTDEQVRLVLGASEDLA